MVEAPPAGWQVWNEEDGGRLVLAYRPDVFDSSEFPAACLPTIAAAPGDSPDQLAEQRARSTAWYRALYLEPAVRVRAVDERYGSRDAAVDGALALAAAFSAGEVDYRGAYQQPRERYLDRLDELLAGEA